jgi:hypothetical protein
MLIAMDTHKTALERAFDLARAGGCDCIAAIVMRLKREGYDGHQIEGRQLRKQLSRLIVEAKERSCQPDIMAKSALPTLRNP